MPKFATISPTSVTGQKQAAWERFRDGHYVAIGWLNDIDVTGKSVEEIKELIRQAGCEPSDERDGLRSFPRFLELEVGDYVAVKNVSDGFFGLGIIDSVYKFDPEKHDTGGKDFFYPHYREVKWIIKEYMPRKSLIRKGEKAWQPYGTVGQVYPELPPYIVRVLKKAGFAVDSKKAGSAGSPEDSLIEDINDIQNSNRDSTTKEALVKARKGQGVFRTQVLQRWGNACAVTGSLTLDAIRASHIKPWKQSSDAERLDPANGLPLVASLDALFDRGLISFEGSGKMIVSGRLSKQERRIFGITGRALMQKPAPETAKYLKYHRQYRFQK
ncbi:MAG TPA: HNH endonuclease [Gemmataceae bacterium]|jgi:hypothetical protein